MTASFSATSSSAGTSTAVGLNRIDHFIFIVQENRSFDQYFGTYPGADGIPTNPDGSFSVCVPDKFQGGICVPPYVTRSDNQDGGPHTHVATVNDVDGGKMDGFIGSLPYMYLYPPPASTDTAAGQPQNQENGIVVLGVKTPAATPTTPPT